MNHSKEQNNSPPRLTPELKEEAVRQIIERGYSVAEVSARLGVIAKSHYKWVAAVKPETDQQASELLAAKSEILRLRAQLYRTVEENDILKRPLGTLERSTSEVQLH